MIARLRSLATRLAIPAVLLLLSSLGWGLSMFLASQNALDGGKDNLLSLLSVLRIESEMDRATSLPDAWRTLNIHEAKYPPLFYLSALLFRAVSPFHDDRLASLTMMLAFFPVLGWGVYLLLRSRLRPGWALLGSCTVVLSPGTLQSASLFSAGFPCMADIALAVGLATRTRPFERWRDTLALAVVCGLGLMLHYSMPIFLAGPILFAFITALRENPGRHVLIIRQAVLFIAVAGLIAAPYYIAPANLSWAQDRSIRFTTPEGMPAGQNLNVVFRAALWIALYAMLLIVALWQAGLLVMLPILILGRRSLLPLNTGRRRMLRPNHVGGSLIATILISLLFFSVFGNKNMEYTMPLAPLFAYPFCLALADEYFQKRWRLAVSLGISASVLGVSLTLIFAQWFPQRMVDSVIDPLVRQCQGANPPCLVVAHYCNPFINVLLQANRGWDPQRMWINNPPPPNQGGPAAESVDFFLIEKGRHVLGGPELHPFDETCALIPQLDPQTGEVSRLIYHGRDVTEMFVQQARADGSDKSLIIYRQRNSRLTR